MGEAPNKNQLIDEMLTAIKASMNYLQKQGGSFYFLKEGSFQGEVQGNNLYEFATDYLDDIPEDTDIELKVDGKTYEGKIYVTDPVERRVQVSLNVFIAKDIPEAKLIVTNAESSTRNTSGWHFRRAQLLKSMILKASSILIAPSSCTKRIRSTRPPLWT